MATSDIRDGQHPAIYKGGPRGVGVKLRHLVSFDVPDGSTDISMATGDDGEYTAERAGRKTGKATAVFGAAYDDTALNTSFTSDAIVGYWFYLDDLKTSDPFEIAWNCGKLTKSGGSGGLTNMATRTVTFRHDSDAA
jgi:hypothetical protein